MANASPLNQVIIIGGGLAGLSAAHTVLERGGSVLVIDKSPFLGGNSTKATSGINGSYTQAQAAKGIKDSPQTFAEDTNVSFHGGKDGPMAPLVRTLAYNSGPAVQWLSDKFKLDLSIVSFMGGGRAARCHRGPERFPGMTITYALMDTLEKIEKAGGPARILTRSCVTRLLRDAAGTVNGVEYTSGGRTLQAFGPVVVATGGFGADFSKSSLLAKYRPELLGYATTNGEHCTGDGMKMGAEAGAGLVDMEWVQVHPTGLVHPEDPQAKVKWLAAEALRGTGGIMLDANAKRFCNEVGRRDYCTAQMEKGKGPFRLVLNSKSSKEIHWHCKHYTSRGLMKHFASGAEVAKEFGVPVAELKKTFDAYNRDAAAGKDEYGKTIFNNGPYEINDSFFVAIITPVVHYCMGGLFVDERSRVLAPSKEPIAGLFAAGEVAGGVHGRNRLGGNSLLDCVVYGRVAGDEAAAFLLRTVLGGAGSASRLAVLQSQLPAAGAGAVPAAPAPPTVAAAAPAATGAPNKTYTLADVAKHRTENDCWVVVGKQVLDVTKFMPDHPGGKKAIMLYAGKDATEEFDMLHKREVIEKYAPESVIGTLA